MSNGVPSDPCEFDKLMSDVDKQLLSSEIKTSLRPLRALGVVAERFGLELPLGPPPSSATPELRENWLISERIRTWYDHMYGEKLKMPIDPGSMAILIRGEVWVINYPLMFGRMQFFASSTKASTQSTNSSEPAQYNVLDAIKKLPVGLKASLSDKEHRGVLQEFILGFRAHRAFQALSGDELVRYALADISAAIDHLEHESPNCELSKWSSLQAAEKTIKAVIKRKQDGFPYTHKLDELAELAKKVGISDEWKKLIPDIQCGPGIRYGKESCDINGAIRAHHATFELVLSLKSKAAN
ncbi:MAG: HEPN domain-containing protein [Phycisphaeraceae bacterium]|nr:HEPN domain-containing protein [Phycisphaeraceae bacterium]